MKQLKTLLPLTLLLLLIVAAYIFYATRPAAVSSALPSISVENAT